MNRLFGCVWGSSLISLATSAFVACAENDTSPSPGVPEDEQPVLQADAATDGDTLDAGDGGDAGDATTGCADASSIDGCKVTTDCTAVDFCAAAFPVPRQTALNAVWGSGHDDVWAVGTRGTILHGDGTSFRVVATGTTNIYLSVWGSGKNDVWTLTPATPLHSTGFENGTATFTEQKGSTWVSNPRIWAGFSTSNAGTWIAGDYSYKFGDPPSSFWQLGQDADGGAAWKSGPSCPDGQYCTSSIRSIWGTNPQNVWAVGGTGQAFRLDDTVTGRWTQLDTRSNNTLLGIWGSSPSDVWAVGEQGTILHTTSTTGPWTTVTSPTKTNLRSIWGSSANDIWAVGDGGTVLHYDGSSWSIATIGLDPGDPATALLGIWGSGPDDVWIVGEGVILHRTATSRRHP